MLGAKPGSLGSLVDIDRGIVSREIFVNDEIYRRELEQVFARAWLFVGHESRVPRAGDYLASSMGEESVILCRDRGGRVHVFLNSCRHRGMKVFRYDEGNTVEFLCCGIGSWGGRRPSLGDYVTVRGPTDGVTAAGGG
jgi:phenylpropionate dioxygenase-like ring-hydroxylating dioxygenase large terminal subunit